VAVHQDGRVNGDGSRDGRGHPQPKEEGNKPDRGQTMDLKDVYEPIESDLLEVDKQCRVQLLALCEGSQFIDRVIHFFFQIPGKKLRPSLVLMSAYAMRGGNLAAERQSPVHRNLVMLATISELVHSASLMHDDVLDDAETRRGIPSLNAKFGNRVAILAGDILYSHAFEILAETSDKRIFLLLTQCVNQMCRGEIINLSEHDFAAYQQIIEDKTASFMAFCCEAGALTVAEKDHNPAHVAALSRFGRHFGMVYQLYDDLGDQDDPTALVYRDRIVQLLDRHIAGARESLTCLPASIYTAKLGMLLDYVVSRYEPTVVASAGAV
jgi:geranylgeranyl pyrophosphate synthase